MRDPRLNLHSLSKLKITFLADGRAQVASYRTHSVTKAELTGNEAVAAECCTRPVSKRPHCHCAYHVPHSSNLRPLNNPITLSPFTFHRGGRTLRLREEQ